MKKNKSKIGILGFGEVGQAIAKFYGPAGSPQVKIKDLSRDDGLEGVDVLNICIPWNNRFVETIQKEIRQIKPKLVIIHSTAAPETTKKLTKIFPNIPIVHSPIRGVHPNLYKGVKTFVKYIGADKERAGKLAKKHFDSLGIKTKVFSPSITTEIGKLLDTTYYALVIAWHGEMKKICDKTHVDFEKTIIDFNRTYNEGYKKLGKLNVIRPVLYPPVNNVIGGHCLIPNTEILSKYFKSKAFDLIFQYKKNNK